jgi:UDP-N-acetylmuramoyl-tripeptide--D-alanyl-D-alanine ligase
VLVANADDARIITRARGFGGRTVTFGVDRDADIRATNIQDRGIEGISARITTPRGAVDVTTPLVGRANLANVLAATAVALHFDVPLADIAAKAAGLRPASHRGEVVRLAGGVTVVDDSYNANPTATKRASTCSRAPARRGASPSSARCSSSAITRRPARGGRPRAADAASTAVAVGGPAARDGEAAVAAGMAAATCSYFATSDEAAAWSTMVQPGDVVLVKGSRGVRRIVWSNG